MWVGTVCTIDWSTVSHMTHRCACEEEVCRLAAACSQGHASTVWFYTLSSMV